MAQGSEGHPVSDNAIHNITTEVVSPLTAMSGSSSASSADQNGTYPLSDDIIDYSWHNGRRFHRYREGSYPWPNDAQEQERMNFQFNCIKAAQKYQLFFAPVQKAKTILDVGTGTGIWCIAMADSEECPDAEITGIDLSPIQPTDVPINVKFEVQDCNDSDWARPLSSIDFVYCQSLFGSLENYQQLLITARKYITPGTGWIECCELDVTPCSDDGTMPENYSLKRWAEEINRAADINGKPFHVGPKLKQWMVDAGYIDVQEVIAKIPIGSWPKDPQMKKIGRAWQTVVSQTLTIASLVPFEQAFGYSEDQTQVVCAQAQEDLRSKKFHVYHRVHTVYGRRPSPEEEKTMARRMGPPPVPSRSAAAPEAH